MKRCIAILYFAGCFMFAPVLPAQNDYITTIHPFTTIIKPLLPASEGITALLPAGASPHTFEMRPSDARSIANARALIFGGANLDDWAVSVYAKNRIDLISLIPDSLRVYLDEEKKITDPHFWTDPLTVIAMLDGIADRLCALDPEHCDLIHEKCGVFGTLLQQLDARIRSRIGTISNRNIMISHPFFNYFLRRYRFNLVGIIETVPGKEPGPREISGLIEAGKRHHIRAVFVHGQHEARSAAIVADGLNVPVVSLDPIGSPDTTPSYTDLIMLNVNRMLEVLK